MKEIKQTYNLDIHPLVERISLVCMQIKIPGFMIFQDDQNEFRVSAINVEDSLNKMLVGYLLQNYTNGDEPIGDELDLIISEMISNAQIKGHNSVFLDTMGIPRVPSLDKSMAETEEAT